MCIRDSLTTTDDDNERQRHRRRCWRRQPLCVALSFTLPQLNINFAMLALCFDLASALLCCAFAFALVIVCFACLFAVLIVAVLILCFCFAIWVCFARFCLTLHLLSFWFGPCLHNEISNLLIHRLLIIGQLLLVVLSFFASLLKRLCLSVFVFATLVHRYVAFASFLVALAVLPCFAVAWLSSASVLLYALLCLAFALLLLGFRCLVFLRFSLCFSSAMLPLFFFLVPWLSCSFALLLLGLAVLLYCFKLRLFAWLLLCLYLSLAYWRSASLALRSRFVLMPCFASLLTLLLLFEILLSVLLCLAMPFFAFA